MPNNKIPDDIIGAASSLVDAMPQRPPFRHDVLSVVACAIIAERARCERAALAVADDYYKRARAFDNLPPLNKGSANTEAHFGAMIIVGKIRSGK